MKSKLTKKEFKKRLTELTSPEKDFYILTSYNSSGTPFCGTFNDSTFDLTRNSFWRHVKSVSISGQFKELDKTSTEVIYEVGISSFGKKVLKVLGGLAFVGLNAVLIFNDVNLRLIMFINGWLIFMCLWGLGITWLTTKLVNQRFKQEFEIEDETALPTT